MRIVLFGIIAAAAIFACYIILTNVARPDYALEVDATRDTTDISGTMYRIRVVNIGTERLTGITAELGVGDVQQKDLLDPGQTYYFYPAPETLSPTIRITTNEGVEIITSYRSPAKTIGLPGAGR